MLTCSANNLQVLGKEDMVELLGKRPFPEVVGFDDFIKSGSLPLDPLTPVGSTPPAETEIPAPAVEKTDKPAE